MSEIEYTVIGCQVFTDVPEDYAVPVDYPAVSKPIFKRTMLRLTVLAAGHVFEYMTEIPYVNVTARPATAGEEALAKDMRELEERYRRRTGL